MIDNVELILKTINNQHTIESQDNDQPDYDSVASDEDTDLEATASKANRQKVRGHTGRETVILLNISSPAPWKCWEVELSSLTSLGPAEVRRGKWESFVPESLLSHIVLLQL